MTDWLQILNTDAVSACKSLADESVNCIVTSPPYWGLRSYLRKDDPLKPLELGQEKTPVEYVENLVSVFREARRVLRKNGTLWLNLGDSYANDGKWGGHTGGKHVKALHCSPVGRNKRYTGLKPKDLCMIPARVALALQADGWWLRQEIIWSKPNPMPESVLDRCTRAHENIFMLTKSARYFYDAAAIKEPPSPALLQEIAEGYNGEATKLFGESGVQDASKTKSRIIEGKRRAIDKQRGHSRRHDGFNDRWDHLTKKEQMACGSNKRSVWTVATAPYKGAHFATFPPALITPCILAVCPKEGIVFDPFAGSGTTGMVALSLRRRAILNELNEDYLPLIHKRCEVQIPML